MCLRGLYVCYCVTILVSIFDIGNGQSVRLEPCTDGVFEIEDNTTDNTITCHIPSGRRRPYTKWRLEVKSPHLYLRLGRCSGAKRCRTSSSNDVFKLTPTSRNASTLTISTTHRNYSTVDKRLQTGLTLFGNSTISCEERRTDAEASCTIDFVRPAQDALCNVTFNTDTSTWSVVSHCDVSRMFSAMGRYTCRLMIYDKGDFSPYGSAVNMTISRIADSEDVKGSCDMTSHLPSSDGEYNFSVEITPGRKKFQAQFTGTNRIRKPTLPLKHNCPEYVTGGSDLDCACVTRDAGSPPGKLWWDETKSAQLLRHNVQLVESGTLFTCQLEWNGTTVTSLSYNLSVFAESESIQKTYISGLATVVGSGLGVGVIVVTVLVAVFILRRHAWKLPCSSESDLERESREARQKAGMSKDVPHPCNAGADQATSGDSSNFYETCDTSQIELQNPYEALTVKYKPKGSKKRSKKKSAKKNSAFTLDDEDDVYENVTTVQGR